MDLLTQQRWVMPADINTQGVLFGGRLLEWVDQDSSMACYKILRDDTQLVTAGMDRVIWLTPVVSGKRLKMTYQLAHIGKTAVTVYVAVEQGEQQVFRAFVSLVGLSHGKPSEVSMWLRPEAKGLSDSLRSSPLWSYVEKIRSERITDPQWSQS